MTDQQYREAARLKYQREGEIEIDDNAVISRSSDPGAYVAAWVWVEDPSGEASEDDPDQEEPEPDFSACTECGAPADDGEGWDGKCGNCADRKSKS